MKRKTPYKRVISKRILLCSSDENYITSVSFKLKEMASDKRIGDHFYVSTAFNEKDLDQDIKYNALFIDLDDGLESCLNVQKTMKYTKLYVWYTKNIDLKELKTWFGNDRKVKFLDKLPMKRILTQVLDKI